MLSWDEFDKELRDEYAVYYSSKQSNQYRSTEISHSDSEAVRRAKAALDILDREVEDTSESILSLLYEPTLFVRRIGEPTTLVSGGTYTLYNFHNAHTYYSNLRDSFNRIAILFAAYLVSSITCSLVTAALNAKLRTPLFAYDAELSIDRHRLRSAF